MFKRRGETKELVDKPYPLHRKVERGSCGRDMIFKADVIHGREDRYFACLHAVTRIGEDACCREWIKEEYLNEIVWTAVKTLMNLTDAAEQKVKVKKIEAANTNTDLQRSKEKCDSDRFSNVDMFMAGKLDKDVYQKRRVDLTREVEGLDVEIEQVEAKLKEAVLVRDDSVEMAIKTLKKYSGAKLLDQKIVQVLVE